MAYTIEYGEPGDRRVLRLDVSEVLPALDGLKANGGVGIIVYGPDGEPMEEHYLRRAVEGFSDL